MRGRSLVIRVRDYRPLFRRLKWDSRAAEAAAAAAPRETPLRRSRADGEGLLSSHAQQRSFFRAPAAVSLCTRCLWVGGTAERIVQGAEVGGPEEEADDVASDAAGETADLAIRRYLRDARGASDENVEFIAKIYPRFMAKLLEFVKIRVGEGQDSEAVQSCIRHFMEEEREGASNEFELATSPGRERGPPTLEQLMQLESAPTGHIGNETLFENIAILNSLGWWRNRLREILDRNPELKTWTAEQLQANIRFLSRAGVRKQEILSFAEDPAVFTLDLATRLDPLMRYLEEIGVGVRVVGDLLKFNPLGLIKMPIDNFRERVNFLLGMGLSSSEVEKCLQVFPQLVHLRLANLEQKVDFFKGIGVDKETMVKIVAKLPSIFRHSIENNLVPKVQMLAELGLAGGGLVHFICRYPAFFGCSIENLKQKLAFFESNGLTGRRLLKMITWHPRAFSFSVDDNLRKKLDFLVGKGFELRSPAMARALPCSITMSTDSLEARFQNLQSIGFSPEAVCDLVKRQPTILCLSKNTIWTKVDYLVNDMNRSTEEILKFPGYLIYSLESRIKPRHRVVKLLISKGVLRQDSYSLSTLLQLSEKDFMERFVRLDPDCFDLYVRLVQDVSGEQESKVTQVVALELAPEEIEKAQFLHTSVQEVNATLNTSVAVT